MPELRVCLLADYSFPADEGMKKSAFELSKRIEVSVKSLRVNVRQLLDCRRLWEIRAFSPHILHYFHGPTVPGLTMMRVLALWTGAKTVISATHPSVPLFALPFMGLVRTDMILVQSESMISSLGKCSRATRIVPSGVDLATFAVPSEEEKLSIRKELGFESDERIGLHIGSLSPTRDLDWIVGCKSDLDRVVIVASTSTDSDAMVLEMLTHAGCEVHQEYVPNIEKYYKAADVYLFPTHTKGGSIDLPLSVLEALASGLPVVTYPTPSILDYFTEGGGFVYVSNAEDIDRCVKRALDEKNPEILRNSVLKFSWDSIAEIIVDEYRKVAGG